MFLQMQVVKDFKVNLSNSALFNPNQRGNFMPTTAQLTWTASTQNNDGSAANNLAGYDIDHRIDNVAQPIIPINNPAAESADIANLPNGPLAFRIRGRDSDGTVGPWSQFINIDSSSANITPSAVAGFDVTFTATP